MIFDDGDDFPISDNTTKVAVTYLGYYLGIDVDLTLWLLWLFTPIAVAFLLPLLLLLFIYMMALYIHVYKFHRSVVSSYRSLSLKKLCRDSLRHAYERDFFEGARHTVAAFWEAQAWIWHGYEIHGLENIPEEGRALLVYYHGAIPIDYYYVIAKCILYRNRLIHSVGDNFLFNIPGWSVIMEAFQVIPGTIQTCASVLRKGELLAISPGGVYEALFSNEYYQLLWRKRVGFAKVAIEGQAPVLPMFTQNVREAYRYVQWGSGFWRWLYLKTRLPLIPIYGNFPVKLRTFIGKPIPFDSNTTPEQLAKQTSQAIESLMREHQQIPGSVLRALWQRVKSPPVKKS